MSLNPRIQPGFIVVKEIDGKLTSYSLDSSKSVSRSSSPIRDMLVSHSPMRPPLATAVTDSVGRSSPQHIIPGVIVYRNDSGIRIAVEASSIPQPPAPIPIRDFWKSQLAVDQASKSTTNKRLRREASDHHRLLREDYNEYFSLENGPEPIEMLDSHFGFDM